MCEPQDKKRIEIKVGPVEYGVFNWDMLPIDFTRVTEEQVNQTMQALEDTQQQEKELENIESRVTHLEEFYDSIAPNRDLLEQLSSCSLEQQ